MRSKYDEKYLRELYSSRVYERYIELRNRFIRKEINKFIRTGKFLDIGFGNGNLIDFFQKDFEIFGIDISKDAIEKVEKNYKTTALKKCDISKQPIPFVEKFDCICAINVIEHIENPEFGLKNIFNALKNGGIFVIYLPTRSNFLSKLEYKLFYDVEEHIFRPSVRTIRNLLKSSGLRGVEEYAARFIPLKIRDNFFVESSDLYLGIWKK